MRLPRASKGLILALMASTALSGCMTGAPAGQLPPAAFVAAREQPGEE